MKSEWTKWSFNSEEEVILYHHNNLIKALDKVVHTDNYSLRSDVVSTTMDKIIQYFEFFNNFERHYLKHQKYPHYEKHIAQYKKFLSSYTAICENIAGDRKSAKNNFISLSKDLYKHLLTFKLENGHYTGEKVRRHTREQI